MSHLGHLVRRFFGSVGARRPGPTDQSFVAQALRGPERAVFWDQPVPDQAHAIRAARRLPADRVDLLRAALLHDVGKRHSGLGTFGRSLATALALVRWPVRGRMADYLAHAESGAGELAGLGCEDLVTQFTEHHHGDRPGHIAPDDWLALVEADDE